MKDILELDRDFDLDVTDPKDVIESLGIDELTFEELLQYLSKGNDEAQFGLATFSSDDDGMRKYHYIGKRYAPIAYEIFMRLAKKKKSPRIDTFLAANRHQSTGVFPNTIIYWADPDAITGLYEALKKDGYYPEKKDA